MPVNTGIALVGQVLGESVKLRPGIGTHLHGTDICASLTGFICQSNTNTAGTAAKTIYISRQDPTQPSVPSVSSSLLPTQTILPAVGAVVLARVTRINPRQATVEILVVGESPCVEGWQGLIRVQDIRATEKDKIKVVESFRPGDVVRAIVVSRSNRGKWTAGMHRTG